MDVCPTIQCPHEGGLTLRTQTAAVVLLLLFAVVVAGAITVSRVFR